MPPARHWRSYTDEPLPTPAEALAEPFAASRRGYDGMPAYAATRCLGVRSRARQGNRKIMLEPR
jgi:hypothetical protein